MFIFPKYLKQNSSYSYTKEYNILSIISMSLVILSFLCILLGSTILYSYLYKLGKINIFIESLDNEIIYATAFSSIFILVIISIYSIIPSLTVKIFNSSATKKMKTLCLTDIFISNMIFIFLLLELSIQKTSLSEWEKDYYLINGIFGILIAPTVIYLVWSFRKEIQERYYRRNKKNDLTTIEIILKKFGIIIPSMLATFFVLNIGIKSEQYDIVESIFLFWILPLIALLISNDLILSWKNKKVIEKTSYILLSVFIWLISIYNFSPFVMAIIGINDTRKTYCINQETEGKIIFNYKENKVFLKEGDLYRDSILLEKKEAINNCKKGNATNAN